MDFEAAGPGEDAVGKMGACLCLFPKVFRAR